MPSTISYTVADWSERFFNNRTLFSDYYLNDRLCSLSEWSEDANPLSSGSASFTRVRRLSSQIKEESLLCKELFEPVLTALVE